MEAFLHSFVPRVIPEGKTYKVHAFNGKMDLLKKLDQRLRAYSKWLPADWRIIVAVDRDAEDCINLKERLELAAKAANLRTKSLSPDNDWQLANRIVIEELEAWYFGDWQAVLSAYPRARAHEQTNHRHPDAIPGGTWEAFERILQKRGYFKSGLPKIEVARNIGMHIDQNRSSSPSFHAFCNALSEAVTT